MRAAPKTIEFAMLRRTCRDVPCCVRPLPNGNFILTEVAFNTIGFAETNDKCCDACNDHIVHKKGELATQNTYKAFGREANCMAANTSCVNLRVHDKNKITKYKTQIKTTLLTAYDNARTPLPNAQHNHTNSSCRTSRHKPMAKQ